MTARVLVSIVLCAAGALAADTNVASDGKKEETHSCTQCHSLRLVDSQRLSKTAWTKEVDKMIGWGAPVQDRQLIIDYLSQQYSDSRPIVPDGRTADAAKRAGQQ